MSPELILLGKCDLPTGRWQVINPPADWQEANVLPDASLYSQEWAIARHYPQAEFGLLPTLAPEVEHVLLFLPKAKPRFQQLLASVASQISVTADVWIVGENSGGIKSAPKQLVPHFLSVTKVASAKRCGLLHCQQAQVASEDDDEAMSDMPPSWQAYQDWSLCGLPGLFNKGEVDRGTELLMKHLPKMYGRVLDMGCGGGVLSLAALGKGAESVLAVDSSAIALAAAQQTFDKNGAITAQVLASDVFSDVPRNIGGSFDWVISNPPFHTGIATDYQPVQRLIQDGKRYVKSGGRLMFVANRHLPYEQWLDASFKRWEQLEQQHGFKVLVAYQ